MYLVGKGALINATTGVEFPHYADLKLTFDAKTVNIPFGDRNGSDFVTTDQTVTGHLSWEQVDLVLLAALLGSNSTAGTIKRMRLEEHIVPDEPGPYVVTLDKATNITLTEVVKDEEGNRFSRVSEDPAEGEYTITADDLTFHESAAAKKVFIDYFYTDGDGKHITIGPYDLPSSFKLIGCVRVVKSFPDDAEGEMVIVANRCVRNGAIEIGGRSGEVSGLGFDFSIVNRSPGDLTVYFP